jgi:catechol 2,3-dioxygenase-like lactoylglutathione lyase family enzyme
MSDPSPVHELRVAVTVDDYAAALAFYRDALGLPVIRAWDDTSGRGVLLDAGRGVLELLSVDQAAYVDEIETGRGPAGASIRLALQVDDAAALAAHLVSAGAEALGSPVETPWGHHNARLRAPEGTQLTLFTVPDDGAAAGGTDRR